MSEMIERVARALATSDGYDPDDTTDVGFKVRNIAVWRAYERLARAAIEAMREPPRLTQKEIFERQQYPDAKPQ